MRKTPVGVAALSAAIVFLFGCGPARPVSIDAPHQARVRAILVSQETSASTVKDEPFAVAEAGPSGTVPHENLEGGVWVLFNKPVVALKTLEKPSTSSSILVISPPVKGIYRWYGSRLLAFEPKEQLDPATEYRFAVSQSLRSLEGENLTGTTSFSFRTEPLGLVSVTPRGDDVPPEADQLVIVTFNFPVDLKTIVPFIRLEADGKNVPFKAARPEITDKIQLGPYENVDRLVSLQPSRDLPRNAEVSVRVLAGAKPLAKNYGTDKELSAEFHTLRALALEENNVYAGREGATAELRFNHPLNEETVSPNLRLRLKSYSLEKNLEVSGAWVLLHNLHVDFESTFTMDVLAGITDQYGQKLGADRKVSFEVGPAATYVDFRGTGQKLLEAQFPPKVAVEMQNVDEGRYTIGRMTEPFAKIPLSHAMAIDTAKIPRNQRHFELFDLSPYLDGGKGAAFLTWRFNGKFWGSDEPQDLDDTLVVQVTDIGASVHVAYNSLLVMAASLSTGAPIGDAAMTLRSPARTVATGRTDATGLASLALPSGALMSAFRDKEEQAELVIVKGKDRLVLRPHEMPSTMWNSNEPYSAEIAMPLTYIWSDRGIYRPGETVSFAGFDKNLVVGTFKAVTGKFRVDLVSGSEDSSAIGSATGTTLPSGSFSGQVKLPANAEPGDMFLVFHRIAGKEDTRTGSAYLQVANFRRVAFSVDLSLPDQRKFMGDSLEARFSGNYLAGGVVSNGKWSWFWTRRETWYQPPGDALADYTFGDVEKGWAEDLGSDSGTLGSTGTTVASQKLADGEKGRVYSYEIAATVEDVDRQAISKKDSRLVFSSAQMLGGKITASSASEDSLYFVKKGEPFTLKVVSVDPDGKPLATDPVAGQLLREEWKLVRELAVGGTVDTHYEREEIPETSFTVTPARPWGAAQIATQKAGSYIIELIGKDAKGRESYTRLSFYSTGLDEIVWQRSDERRLDIVPDKKLYAPGDTAHLLIKSPLSKGTYLVSVEREGVLEKKVVDLAGSAPTIDVAIKEGHVPAVFVFVSASMPRTQPPANGPDVPDFGKPRGYSGVVELPVRTDSRTITVALTNTKASYLPGEEASVKITATMNGKPMEGAEIALVAADRGVLDLIDYRIPNPVDFFYSAANFPDKVAHYDSRDLLLDPVTWKARNLPGGDEKGESAAAPAGAAVRKDFNPTAVFRTGLVTGKDGSVTVRFKLPDLLTRFRSTAVALKGDRFGIAEGEILVQNPINVRTALPRRLRVGDAATAGVVLTNLDPKPRAVTVALDAKGISVQGAARKTVTLQPGGTAEIAFALQASNAGTARFSFRVDSDILKETLLDTLSIADEHLNESFTVVGKTTAAAREALVVPPSFMGTPEEGLYLTLDSTIASSMAGAVKFVDVYPYDCLEQVTSKLFARVLFPALSGGADLTTLSRFANRDGGFSYWDDPPPRRSNYYVSLRVAHLLAIARAKDLAIPADIDTEALLKYLDDNWQERGTYLQAYALYVFSQYGRDVKERLDELAAHGDQIGVFGYGFLGLAYDALGEAKSAQAVLGRLKNFVRVGTRTVTLVGTVNDWMWYGGNVQAKALLLMLYARVQPDSQLVLGLANDLLASATAGHWENTSNDGWVLQAFAEIVDRGGEAKADFTASVKLGGAEIAANGFKGLSKAPYAKQVPAARLTEIGGRAGQASAAAQLPLDFGLTGKGTLYYTAQLRYSIPVKDVEPRDEGIGIATEIIDDTGNAVSGTSLALGKVYTMRVVFYSSQDRTFLALRAPIPSGAEPIDGSLLTSQIVKQPPTSGENDQGATADSGGDAQGDYGMYGYTTKIYDSEVRFFFDQLDRGKHEVRFLFRTTTPGTYPTPPVQAELMYQPEVFGRTAGTMYGIAQ